MVKSLTKEQIQHIQYKEGVVFINYGEADERYLAPTRGGGEFNASVTLRDIEFDGRMSKTKGTQVIEEQEALLKITTLCLSPDNLKATIPNAVIEKDGEDQHEYIENPECGVVNDDAYYKNVTLFCKTLGDEFIKVSIFNSLNENGLGFKAQPKAEAELALEIYAHDDLSALGGKGKLWRVDWLKKDPGLDFSKDGLSKISVLKTSESPVVGKPLEAAAKVNGEKGE